MNKLHIITGSYNLLVLIKFLKIKIYYTILRRITAYYKKNIKKKELIRRVNSLFLVIQSIYTFVHKFIFFQ